MDIFEMRSQVSEEQISELVQTFYQQVQQDPELGPIFGDRVASEAWPAHLQRMCDFWSTALLGTGRYRRDPMAAHVPLTEVGAQHFARWLELFSATAHRVVGAMAAAAIEQRAERMAARLRAAMNV